MSVTSPETPQQPASIPYYQPPPQYAPTYPPPVQQRPKKGMPTWAIVLMVVGGIVVALCIGGAALIGLGAKAVNDGNTAAAKDVSVSACTPGDSSQFDLVGPKATIDITNHGSRTASYSVTVEFMSTDGSTQIGTGVALVNDLAPGQTAHADAASFAGGKGADLGNCRVTAVRKY